MLNIYVIIYIYIYNVLLLYFDICFQLPLSLIINFYVFYSFQIREKFIQFTSVSDTQSEVAD